MDFSNKKQALLYLDRNGFYFYESGLSNVLSLGFAETSVKNLDVVDEKSLDNQIQTFSTQAKLAPSNISIILSPNLIFEKDILILEPTQQKEEADKFINTVPFTNVASATYPISNGVKVIGVNEDLFLAVKNSFEKLGCVASLVLPYHALGPDIALLNNFTVGNVSQLMKKLDRLRPFNMLQLKIVEQPKDSIATSPNQSPKSNKRAILMGGFLFVLIVVLVFMLLNMNKT